MLYIPFDDLVRTLEAALDKAGVDAPRAARLARSPAGRMRRGS